MNKIGQIVTWCLSVAISEKRRDLSIQPVGDFELRKGQRIHTTKGPGVLVGGSINILLDKSIPGRHENDRVWSFNLDNLQSRK